MNRVTILSRTILMVLGAGALVMAAGCGDSGTPDGDADVVAADVAADTADVAAPDTTDTTQGDMVGDSDDDVAQDAAEDSADGSMGDAGDVAGDLADDIPGVDVVNPDEIFQPIQDREFAQEINHTGIEIDRRITDIVDILIKPAGNTLPFDDVLVLTSDGVWLRDPVAPAEPGTWEPVKIAVNPTYGPVLGGAYTDEYVLVVQKTALLKLINNDDGQPELKPWMILADFQMMSVTQAYGWIIVADLFNVALFHGDQTRLGITGTTLAVKFATINADHSRIYVAGANGDGAEVIEVWQYNIQSDRFDVLIATVPSPVNDIRQMIADVAVPSELELVVVGQDGIAGYTAIESDEQAPAEIPVFAANRVPLNGATDIAKTADGGFIVTTMGGAMRMINRGDGPEWRFYNTLRWVADNDVRAVATTPDVPDSPIYFGSAAGMTWTTVERMTIEDKMALLREKIELRHDRDGAVADSRLTVPGDLSTSIPWDSDNDGGWTSYWLIAECMRWKETSDPQAKANFDKSLQAMLNLRLLTGEDWFLARALIRKDGCRLDDCDNPDDGMWYTSPDGEWWVKSDTSNDEVTSHLFMMGPAYDLCADETQKKAIAAHVSNIIGGIIDHDYQLLRPTGECTTYGQFDPGYVNFIGLFGDGGQRSVQTLAAMNLAIYMTADQESRLQPGETLDMPGSQKFIDAKAFLMNDENHYDDNVMTSTEPPGRHGNGDGDELSTQAFFILVQYEQDAALKARWLKGWRSVYDNLKTQQSAVWDVIQGVITQTVPNLYLGERWFRLYPLDLIRWNIHNNHRLDLVKAPQYYIDRPEFRERYMRSDNRIIPSDERPNDRHNTSQFQIEGGWGDTVEMDAADVLAAYWMARYYGFIEPADQVE